jgi:peroxidase
LTDNEAGSGLRTFDLGLLDINVRCPWTPEPVCAEIHKKFRTIDGSCNNLKTPNYGRAGTPLQRILEPSYGSKNNIYKDLQKNILFVLRK